MTQTTKVVKLPRGIRNNNPLNMEYHKRNNWHGQLPYNKIIEPRFCRFSHMMWGYRAAACLLKKYINVYRLKTIEEIINLWAPPGENQTNAYVDRVCEISHLSRNQVIDFNDQIAMLSLIGAMTVVECGNAFNPSKNADLWSAMYKGYVMARENHTDFSKIDG